MYESFQMGGWGMYPTLFSGVLLVAVCARYAFNPLSRLVPLMLSLGILTLVSGGLGFVTGVIRTAQALPEVKDASQMLIAALGVGESLHNVALALIFMLIGTVAAVLGAFRLSSADATRRLQWS